MRDTSTSFESFLGSAELWVWLWLWLWVWVWDWSWLSVAWSGVYWDCTKSEGCSLGFPAPVSTPGTCFRGGLSKEKRLALSVHCIASPSLPLSAGIDLNVMLKSL